MSTKIRPTTSQLAVTSRPSGLLARVAAAAARVAGFALLTGVLWLAALAIAARVRCGRYTLLQVITRNYLAPGGRFFSLSRFREAARHPPVDVVVFGSSHAYRGFDPRIFAAAGHSLMNLGSTNQTPLNSRWLAEIYLPLLRPKLVIFEVYHQTLAGDGLESCRDLAVNTPASWPMTRMALASYDFGAIGFAASKALGLTADEAGAEQAPVDGERYVAGGYAETGAHRDRLRDGGENLVFELRSEQLRNLVDATRVARAGGARVIWVMHPLPEDHRRRLENRAASDAAVARAAADAGVPYWNFDERMTLDPLADFSDFHHLSAAGVAKFDRALLAELDARDLW